MSILFVGNEDLDFKNGGLTANSLSANPYTRSNILQNSGTSALVYFMSDFSPYAPMTEMWIHFYGGMKTTSGSDSENWWVAVDNPTAGILCGLRAFPNSGMARFAWNDGSGAMVLSDPLFAVGTLSTYAEYDIHIKITGTTLYMALYGDGALIAEKTATLSTTYSFTGWRLCSAGNFSGSWSFLYNQVVVATTPTIGFKVYTRQPTGNGNYTAFNGDYTAVDEITMDGEVVSTAVAARESFTRDAISGGITSALEVKAVAVSAYVRQGATDLPNVQFFLRDGGVDYDSESFLLSFGYTGKKKIWELDPATGLKFTNTKAASALEFGVRALA